MADSVDYELSVTSNIDELKSKIKDLTNEISSLQNQLKELADSSSRSSKKKAQAIKEVIEQKKEDIEVTKRQISTVKNYTESNSLTNHEKAKAKAIRETIDAAKEQGRTTGDLVDMEKALYSIYSKNLRLNEKQQITLNRLLKELSNLQRERKEYNKQIRDAETAQRREIRNQERLIETSSKLYKSYGDQASIIREVTKVASNNNLTEKETLTLVRQLVNIKNKGVEINSSYVSSLGDEAVKLREAKKELDSYISSLKTKNELVNDTLAFWGTPEKLRGARYSLVPEWGIVTPFKNYQRSSLEGQKRAFITQEKEKRANKLREKQWLKEAGLDTDDKSNKSMNRIQLISSAMAFAGIKEAMGNYVDYKSALSSAQAVINPTIEQMKELRDIITDLGEKTVFTTRETAEGVKYLGMAGMKTTEILKVLPSALDLASAGEMDLGRAADIATNIMSSFNMEAKDFTQAADSLAYVAANSNTSVEQLAQGMKYAGPSARAAGVSLKDTTAILGALANAGIQASTGGTSLRMILSSLAKDPAPKASKAIKDLGVEFKSLSLENNNLIDVITTLSEKGITLGQAIQIFGVRAANSIMALVSNIDDLKRLQSGLSGCAGEAERISKVKIDNLGGDFKLLKSAVEGLVTAVMDSGVGNGLRSLTEDATNLVKGLSYVPKLFGTVAEKTGELSNKVGKLHPIIENFLSPLNATGGVIGNITKAVTALLGLNLAQWFYKSTMGVEAFNAASVILNKQIMAPRTWQLGSGAVGAMGAGGLVASAVIVAGLSAAVVSQLANIYKGQKDAEAQKAKTDNELLLQTSVQGALARRQQFVKDNVDSLVESTMKSWNDSYIKSGVNPIPIDFLPGIFSFSTTPGILKEKLLSGDDRAIYEALKYAPKEFVTTYSALTKLANPQDAKMIRNQMTGGKVSKADQQREKDKATLSYFGISDLSEIQSAFENIEGSFGSAKIREEEKNLIKSKKYLEVFDKEIIKKFKGREEELAKVYLAARHFGQTINKSASEIINYDEEGNSDVTGIMAKAKYLSWKAMEDSGVAKDFTNPKKDVAWNEAEKEIRSAQKRRENLERAKNAYIKLTGNTGEDDWGIEDFNFYSEEFKRLRKEGIESDKAKKASDKADKAREKAREKASLKLGRSLMSSFMKSSNILEEGNILGDKDKIYEGQAGLFRNPIVKQTLGAGVVGGIGAGALPVFDRLSDFLGSSPAYIKAMAEQQRNKEKEEKAGRKAYESDFGKLSGTLSDYQLKRDTLESTTTIKDYRETLKKREKEQAIKSLTESIENNNYATEEEKVKARELAEEIIKVKESTEKLNEQKQKQSEFLKTLSSDMTNAIMNAHSFRDALQNLGDVGVNIMKRLAAQWVESKIENMLFGLGNKRNKGGKSFFSPLDLVLASAKGNVFSNGYHLTAYAKGGIVNKPTVFPMAKGMGLMGEAGAEAVMPLKRTASGDLGVQLAGGSSRGGIIISPQITINAEGGSKEENEDAANRINEKVQQAMDDMVMNVIIREQRPGGALYR